MMYFILFVIELIISLSSNLLVLIVSCKFPHQNTTFCCLAYSCVKKSVGHWEWDYLFVNNVFSCRPITEQNGIVYQQKGGCLVADGV